MFFNHQIDSDDNAKITVTIATCIYGKCRTANFQTMILFFILIRFMNFLQFRGKCFITDVTSLAVADVIFIMHYAHPF